MMRYFLIFFAVLSSNYQSNAQSWKNVTLDNIEQKGQRDIKPTIYKVYEINNDVLKSTIMSAPHESAVINATQSKVTIQLPTADGVIHTFALVSYHLLHPDLQKSFPDIKAFYGICLEDATMTVVADYSPTYGIRAVVSQPGVGKTYIDHFQRNDSDHRIVYYRKDYQKFSNWSCGVVADSHDKQERSNGNRGILFGDCLFREYRLALSCTGEYTTFHGGTIAGALAAMNTTMNRINGVFAQDIAIRCVIIANNTNIMYTDGATDPFTNGDPDLMINENQANTDAVIGNANYDAGHVFGTGGSGLAGVGVFCLNGNKARGVTVGGAPIGDPFDIDYVAHEMGHQLGAQHTQNNACNRNNNTAMEPGSASSIMGYAGICNPNVQNNSDENFHAISIQEMKNFLAAGGSNCDIPVAGYNNAPPDISAPANNTTYTIPRSTPFALTMTATDPNGNGILYGWDQMNNDVATMPPLATNTIGPSFRYIEPTTNPTRYFPNLTAILSGATAGAPFGGNNWEVLPSVARTMNFRGVARDITPLSASCNSEVNVVVNTVAGPGPFRVTGLDVPTTWLETQTTNITWDIAGSNAGTINTANVSILMSYDGGLTFPVTLLASTPNDGSQQIIVPNGTTTTARIMVRAVGNIFFDINDANITVNVGVPGFDLTVSPSTVNLCPNQQSSILLEISSILGFNNPVNLSLSGLPSGITSSFSSNPLLPGQNTLINFNNSNALTGVYPIIITGTSGTLTDNVNATINIDSQNPTITLTFPSNNATSVSLNTIFTWTSSPGLVTYQLQVSKRPDFNSLVLNESGITSNSYTVITALSGYSEYYWRVRVVNSCGTGAWSNPSFKFDTESCLEYASTNVPIIISATGTPTVNSVLNISDRGTITDLNVLNLSGFHSYMDDLRFTLFAPSTTNVIIWDRPCAGEDNFNINFDQASALGNNWPCPPTNGLTYQPSNPGTLNTYNGQSHKGQWRLQIQDLFNDDGGSLQSWKLKTCATNFCRLTVDNDAPKGAGSLKAAIDCAVDGDTIRFASTFMNDTISLFNENIVTSKRIYILGDITKNIHLMSSSTSPTIVSSTPNTGFGLRIKGLHIHSSQSTGIGAIQNSGLLTLDNVFLYKNNVSSSTILHDSGGINNISGDCRVLD
jgi:subtilisin-like proprotein convertase family protein